MFKKVIKTFGSSLMSLGATLLSAYGMKSNAALFSSRERLPPRFVQLNVVTKAASCSREWYVKVPVRNFVFAPFWIIFLASMFVMQLKIVLKKIFACSI
jgi:hypothetical protein